MADFFIGSHGQEVDLASGAAYPVGDYYEDVPVEPKEFAFARLPARAFPVTVEIVDEVTRVVRWRVVAEYGITMLKIPDGREVNDGRDADIRFRFGDGKTLETFFGIYARFTDKGGQGWKQF